MKPHGRIERWGVIGQRVYGRMFEHAERGMWPDNSLVEFGIVTEPPFFKTRIVTSRSGKFYVLGEPQNKEDNLV